MRHEDTIRALRMKLREIQGVECNLSECSALVEGQELEDVMSTVVMLEQSGWHLDPPVRVVASGPNKRFIVVSTRDGLTYGPISPEAEAMKMVGKSDRAMRIQLALDESPCAIESFISNDYVVLVGKDNESTMRAVNILESHQCFVQGGMQPFLWGDTTNFVVTLLRP